MNFLLIILGLGALLEAANAYHIVCYYTNWSQYRAGKGKFLPENIDPSLCSHIIYAFAKIENGALAAFEWNDQSTSWSTGMYDKVQALKAQNPALKVLIAVGGWNMGPGPFSDMANNAASRANFVSTTVKFLQDNHFDGLDMDWEYPTINPGSRPGDKDAFTALLKELKSAFASHGFLLTAAVAAGKSNIDSAYDIPNIVSSLDMLNVMAYDYHGSWENFVGQNAPLYNRSGEVANDIYFYVDYTITYYMSKGFPASKIMLGMGTYGRSFTLVDPSKNGVGAPSSGPGTAGTYTGAGGSLAYYEICSLLNQGWTRVWDNQQKVPYAYNGNQWVGYDDVQSLIEKANYLKAKSLGGAMFWSLDTDDFNGAFCNQGAYPLIKAVKMNLLGRNNNINTMAPTASTLLTTLSQTTTKSSQSYSMMTSPATPRPSKSSAATTTDEPSVYDDDSHTNFDCPSDGYFANVNDGCKSYFQCEFYGTKHVIAYTHACPETLLFNQAEQLCDWPQNVKC